MDASGNVVDVHPAEESRIHVVLTWDGASWIVDEVGPSRVPTS